MRFTYDNNILTIFFRPNEEEVHSFNILSENDIIINDIKHTVLTSDRNESFYIVNGQFHREDDKPAITCLRFDSFYTKKEIDSENSKTSKDAKPENYMPCSLGEYIEEYRDTLKLFWCKMWINNGVYHRKDNKPAIIFEHGDLLWFKNGEKNGTPCAYFANYGDAINCLSFNENENKAFINTKEESRLFLKQGVFDYSYENC